MFSERPPEARKLTVEELARLEVERKAKEYVKAHPEASEGACC